MMEPVIKIIAHFEAQTPKFAMEVPLDPFFHKSPLATRKSKVLKYVNVHPYQICCLYHKMHNLSKISTKPTLINSKLFPKEKLAQTV